MRCEYRNQGPGRPLGCEKMSIQLIAMDLDGTALQPDHQTISEGLQQALQEAHRRGIRIVPVTGRPYRLLPPFLHNHPVWESEAVLCNGAEIRDMTTGQRTSYFPIPREQLESILSVSEDYDLPVEFNAEGRLYLTEKTLNREKEEERMQYHCMEFLPQHGILVEDLHSCCDMYVEKVHFNCIRPDCWENVEQALKALNVSVVCEKPPNLEVTHRQATKGQGLRSLAETLQIPMKNVMALGDSGNDLSMLEAAGLSVAMGSAPEPIRAAADYVTGTNLQDGAAAAIRRFVLT